MPDPKNPHDSLFKASFSDKIISGGFLKKHLPKHLAEKIDIDSLVRIPTTYITPKLADFYSDMVYQCKFGDKEIIVSFLFEHKSFVPKKNIFLQLLRYIVEAWCEAEDKGEPIYPILPIILYHGKQKWKKRDFESIFDGWDPLLAPFIPSFEYLLTDLSDFSDEQIMEMHQGLIINTLLLFKHYGEDAYTRKSIQKLFTGLESFVKDKDQRNLIVSFFVYLSTTSKIEEGEFGELLEKLPDSVKKTTMTTYEQIIKKGERKANREKENLFITNAVKKGFDVEIIAELTGLSSEEVQKRIVELGL